MTLNRSWAVVVDNGHISVLSNSGMEALSRHSIGLEGANDYLENGLANNRFSALMLVGAPEDLSHFRKTLNDPVRRCVVAEVIRPNHKPGFLDEHIEEMCA